MKKNLKLLVSIFLLATGTLVSQTADDIKLQRMYWNYRDIFRKYFMNIGPEPGQSVVADRVYHEEPVSSLPKIYNFSTNTIKDYTGTDPLPNYYGYRNFGDATLNSDNYLGILATEYWMLKHYHQDAEALEAVKNEIYFALNAIDRIDEKADRYFNPFLSSGTNTN